MTTTTSTPVPPLPPVRRRRTRRSAKMNHYAIITIFCTAIAFLTGCKDNKPVSASGVSNFWASTDDIPPVYEAIDIYYWSDRNDHPVAAVISILRGRQIQGITHNSKSKDGEITEISITTSDGVINIPLFEESLVKNSKVPVYCSFDGLQVEKVSLSLEEFRMLKSMAKDKHFQSALTLLRTKIAQSGR